MFILNDDLRRTEPRHRICVGTQGYFVEGQIPVAVATVIRVGRIGKYMNDLDHELVEIDSENLGGTPVFRGTRVPIQNLFDCLETGESIEQFLVQFPTVKCEQVKAIWTTEAT